MTSLENGDRKEEVSAPLNILSQWRIKVRSYVQSRTFLNIRNSNKNEQKLPTKNSSSTQDLVAFKKELNLLDGVAFSIGCMIGSGIFVSPGSVVKYSGSIAMSLIVWVATGLMTMMGAMCYAELGTSVPKSGGSYAYVLEAFGPVPAFLLLWNTIIIGLPASYAIISMTFANYLLQPLFPDCDAPPFGAVRLTALATLWFLAFINCIGVKLGTRVQDLLTLLKLLALVIIVAVGIHHVVYGRTRNYDSFFDGTITDPTSIATAFYASSFAYAGWGNLNTISEELKNPTRNLPWAIAISVTTVTIIYALTNMAYFAVLTSEEIESSGAVAVTFGNRTLGAIAWIISLFVAISTFGAMHGKIIANSRVLYVAAREGHFPKYLALLHVNNHTPVPAIISVVLMSIPMLMAPDFISILSYTTFSKCIMSILSTGAFFWLRYKQPERPRPIKVCLSEHSLTH
ncbi:Y+L amino acid transporter 2 [Halocaridina rubra]|uniref:Y+L amino acid transporter 2 n=1 Tax=Halocaridina rubra TaxID=373956 RepID=A0AAN8X2A9_HALRR